MNKPFWVLLLFLAAVGSASAWWDSNYQYRSNIQLNSTPQSNLSDFTYNLTFDSATPIGAGKMLTTCDDLRFTWVNATDGLEYPIPYHLYADVGYFATTSNACAGGNANALAYVRLPQLNGNGLNTSLYLYYGYAAATKGSNPNTTYLFWDDFSGGLNTTRWNISAGTSLSGTWVIVTGATPAWAFTNYSTGITNASFNQSLKVMSIFKDTAATARGLYGVDAGESSFGATGAMTGTSTQFYHVTYNTTRTEAFINNALSQADARKYRNFYGYWGSAPSASVSFTNVSAVGFSFTPIYFTKNIVEESAPTSYTPTIADFQYFQNIEINPNPLNPILEDFVLNVSFDSQTPISEGKLQSSCSDLRFAYQNSTGSYNFIPYYLYEDVGTYGSTTGKCYGGNTNALAFVRIPIIYNTSTTYLRMYYGNASVSAGSNPAQTYLFYDYPQGTSLNLSNWDTNCPAGTTCDVTSNYDRFRIDSGTPTARVGADSTNFPSSFWSKWNSTKRILTMQSSGGDGAAGYQMACISGSTLTCSHGYDLFASGVNDATWKLVQLDFNSTNTRCYVSGSACSVGTGSPTTTAPSYYGYEVANTAPEEMRATNITVVSWAKYYPTYTINTLGSGNINVSAKDELTGAYIYFNASFTNTTSIFTTPNSLNFINSSIFFPQGSNTITFQNASYFSRQIITTITNNSQDVVGYLLPISNPNNIFVRFIISDPNGIAVDNALVVVLKSGTAIASKYTDSSGIAAFYLDSTTSYAINVTTSEGTNLYVPTLTPVQNDYYYRMGSIENINYDFLFANITWSFEPSSRNLYPNASLVNFTITSIDNKLEWYGLVLEYNGSIIFNSSVISSNGGSILVVVNVSNYTNYLVAHPFFKKVGFDEYYDNSFPLWSWSNLTGYFNATGIGIFIVGARDSLGITKENIKPNLTLGLVMLFLGFLFSAFIARTIGVGSGLIAMLVIIVIAMFGVFSPLSPPTVNIGGQDTPNLLYWGWYAWIFLVIIAIIIIRTIGV